MLGRLGKRTGSRVVLALFVFVALGQPSWSAPLSGVPCPSLFDFEEEFAKVLVGRRSLSRMAKIQVEGHTYLRRQVLGHSASRVWLAADENGKSVVMKRYLRASDEWMLTYEKLASEYYAERGIKVPAIIAVDKVRRILIKEYFEGVTDDELYLHRAKLLGSDETDVSWERLDAAMDALQKEQLKIWKVHRGFSRWLKKKHSELPPEFHKVAESLIREGDIKDSNFIYDLKEKRWFLIDP